MREKDQLVYYIPGVGTEKFKPLALLDGATGLGVPANVRKLYQFLSWNWTEDAAIYMFGFSRGAFTIRISGIESPALQSDSAPNYWEAAWGARRFVEQGARRRFLRDQIGMAINSAATRSQDQLHIHVSCVAPVVADFLRRHQAEVRGAWFPLRAKLAGHRFLAMKVETESLAQVEPFKVANARSSLE
jgi:CDP-diacylglycerol pyrophosphatase/Uncharacterized alpha/beta hydrolase domain (DUF2235)